jgi:hypothetical protein
MRLIIKEIIKKELASKLSVNGDLPIKLDVNINDTFDEVLHYEVVTDHDSFFEIEILKSGGMIKSILLTNCNERDIEYVPTLSIDLSEVITGEPLIDTTVFGLSESENYFDKFYREKGFRLLIAENGIKIKLSNNNLSKKIISIGNQCFLGVSDENEINSFIVIWLSKNQKIQFEESISSDHSGARK